MEESAVELNSGNQLVFSFSNFFLPDFHSAEAKEGDLKYLKILEMITKKEELICVKVNIQIVSWLLFSYFTKYSKSPWCKL